ncbi:MAG: class I SAM-dependent methyltransferase [Planctomycetota bacterium JB042]
MTDDIGERMRRDWDARAKEDARHYIATGESDGVLFSLSGCRDAYRILEELHPRLRRDMRVLEIGCGIGRLVQFLALIFDEVHGVDVSREMVEQGRAFLARHENAHLHAGDGRSLAMFPDAHFDLVLSYVVFQHIPDKDVVRRYVAEARRVLRPGGLFKYLVKTTPWEAQGDEHDTWHGVEITREDVEGWNEELGFELVNGYTGDDPTTAWVVARVGEAGESRGEQREQGRGR